MNAAAEHEHTNASIGSTWAMTTADGKLQVVDQVARRWTIESDGTTTFGEVLQVPGPGIPPLTKPFLDLVHLGATPPPTPATMLVQNDPNDTHSLQVWFCSHLEAGFSYRNLLEGIRYVPNPSTMEPWASSHADSAIPPNTGGALHFRTHQATTDRDYQSVRVGLWPALSETTPRVVASTVGGSVIVVDPFPLSSDGTIAGELLDGVAGQPNGDQGYGGMALCVYDVHAQGAGGAQDWLPDGDPEILFGPIATHAGVTPDTRNMVSSFHVYRRTGQDKSLEVVYSKIFDRSSDTPELFGLCGIAVGDLDTDPYDEVVLTTVNGDLVIYDLVVENGQLALGALLQWDIFDGSLGVGNSIVIDDLDGTPGNELYVAGSMGIRKFK